MRSALPLLLFAMAAPAAAQGPAEIQARLRAHDYERARAMALVHPWDLTSEAGRQVATQTWLAFLAETHRRAAEHHRAERHEAAADLAMALLADPPLRTHDGPAPPGPRYLVCEQYCEPESPPTGPRVLAPTDRRTTQRLEDLALFLREASDAHGFGGADYPASSAAQQLLDVIVARHPDRASAHYNLAEMRWDRGLYELALGSYRNFARLRGARTPERVRDRIRQGPPPPPPERRSPWRDEPDDNDMVFQTQRGTLGRIDGGEVRFEASRNEAGFGYWESELVLIWRRGRARHRTIALRETGTYLSGTPRLDGDAVVFEYGASGGAFSDDNGVSERWRWDPATHRFVREARTVEPTAYQVIQARMRAHLAARELEAARGVVLRGGVTDNGSGVIDDADRILDHFLVATHAVARRLARRQPAGAAELCRLLLRDPPAYSLTDAPWTSGRPRDLAACARFLGASSVSGDREAALQALRDQGQAESAADNLALADALYALGDRDAAGAAYRAYLDGEPRRPVARAEGRASPWM